MAGRDWDAVLDVSWQPDQVRSALAALAERAGHWVYVSSCSVYADDSVPAPAEDAALHPPHQGTGGWPIEAYGPAKVACEEACVAAMGSDHSALARAGLICRVRRPQRPVRLLAGPGRPRRRRRAGAGAASRRSAARSSTSRTSPRGWCTSPRTRVPGAFNALGDVTTVGAVLDACVRGDGPAPPFVEVDDGWLAEHEVAPWSGPGVPAAVAAPAGVRRVHDPPQRRRHALRGSPCARSRDTVARRSRWERERGLDRDRHAGLTPPHEAELLAAAD